MDLIKGSASNLIWRGVFAILVGIVSIAWPGVTAVTLTILWGIFAIVTGVWGFGSALADDVSGGTRVLGIIVGALGVIAGISVLFRPGLGAAALAWAIGIWLVAVSIVDIIGAFRQEGQARWMLLVSGVLGIILGWLLIQNPVASAAGLAIWLGIMAIAWGIVLLVVGFQMRTVAKDLNSQNV